MKKITKATIKSFVKKNQGRIFINIESRFDGRVDGIVEEKDGFKKAEETKNNLLYTLGINGAWLVGSSRDSYEAYDDGIYKGFEIYNCVGNFILAVEGDNDDMGYLANIV